MLIYTARESSKFHFFGRENYEINFAHKAGKLGASQFSFRVPYAGKLLPFQAYRVSFYNPSLRKEEEERDKNRDEMK